MNEQIERQEKIIDLSSDKKMKRFSELRDSNMTYINDILLSLVEVIYFIMGKSLLVNDRIPSLANTGSKVTEVYQW